MKLSSHNYSTLQVQNKIKLPKSMSKLESGPPSLLHFGFPVTATLVSCQRHCRLQAVRMENTATRWNKRIGNICNCSKYKHSHRDVPSLPMAGEFLKSMAGALTAQPSPALGCLHSHTLPTASWPYSCTQNSLQARGFLNKPTWNVSGILKQQPHISVVRFLSHMITQIRATTV